MLRARYPLIITTGPATLVPKAIIDHVAPRYIDIVARDFPELKIVVSHGGYPWVNEMINVAQRNANVYLDLSEYEHSPLSDAVSAGSKHNDQRQGALCQCPSLCRFQESPQHL